MTWKQTFRQTLYFGETIIKGAVMYLIPYAWWALIVWSGFALLDFKYFCPNYWQSLGLVIIWRQFHHMWVVPGDKHIYKKENCVEEDEE